jgi:hypothetical protein
MVGSMAQEDKSWFNEVKDKYVVMIPHITKVDKAPFRGMYRYFYPPRIGIDFYSPEDYPNGVHDFVPNLELGDVARLVRILELVSEDDTFASLKSGKIKPFRIGLAFENDLQRRIILGAESNYLIIRYEAYHRGKRVEIEYNLSREGAMDLIRTLKELVIEYVGFIQRYVMLGKIGSKFK